jgi:SAM-dependent methyltransferase
MREIDVLTSATLKHLRDRWWDHAFTDFLTETLQPRAGNRILDVGCGAGQAELHLARLRLSQVELVGVDLVFGRVHEALAVSRAHNVRADFAAADACFLPFRDGAFDSTFCVAVLQHISDLGSALEEFSRVTKPGGRILAVEPDNAARYWYSSTDAGRHAFELGSRLFGAIAQARGDLTEPSVGPKLPGFFARHGIQPIAVRLFPVSVSRLGAPPATVWGARRESVEQTIARAGDGGIRRLGADYLRLLGRYADEASAAGPGFVEIQNTMLFATVGQKPPEQE